jgi:hypothetical protein
MDLAQRGRQPEEGDVTRTDRPVGLSVWEQQLYDLLHDHIDTEGSLLAEYDDLAARSSGHVRYLVEMIGDDEARHHLLFEQWANSIADMGSLIERDDDRLPSVHREDDPERVAAAAERLLAIEHNDAHELRKLRKQLAEFEDTTVWPLIVDLMRLDTEKHVLILEFLRRHARNTIKQT